MGARFPEDARALLHYLHVRVEITPRWILTSRRSLHKSAAAIRLLTLQYLTDRRDGRAKQDVNSVLHAHTGYGDPLLATFSGTVRPLLRNVPTSASKPVPSRKSEAGSGVAVMVNDQTGLVIPAGVYVPADESDPAPKNS